ncbi:MAG: phenylalanine--tRNA ligase subunit beta [Holosporaceae bacterium]|jgi:phenylalanyl-tRNA synthetase beta chain|nr:phenylalanine--tRNA ligase subunit beta [Holosporaceae bacterium]
MRFSFDWLKRYLSTDLDVKMISDKLTSIGLEVEHIEDPAVIFKNFKLVRVKDAQKHPQADKLKVCIVEDADGNESHIVCGAKNVCEGLKTILAMPGAKILSSGEILKKSKIRGIVSEGMMCSHEELGLSSDRDGIIEVEPDIGLSTPVDEVLGYGKGIFEISVTPNRGDCLSIKGIARDLAATGVGKFLMPEEVICPVSFKFPINITYENSESCRQYAPIMAFRVIRGVRNGKSPRWLKLKLQSAGLNSISTLVDLSNFWMMDSGRPTHIYDLKKIKGNISIRFARNKEVFEDIKGNEHKLLTDMLISADEESPLCLLGVMGGKKIACNDDTTDILIESGLFDQIFISKTGTILNLNSDSRIRFERNIDKNSCISGLEGITQLILENCGGEASETFVIGKQLEINKKITLRKSKLNNVSGCVIDWNVAKLILKKLGLEEIRSNELEATFLTPSWRSDLNIEEDLIEEVLRIKGYDTIRPQNIDIIPTDSDKILERKNQVNGMKRLLASRGLSEVVTYSFMKENYAESFKEDRSLIHLINPISTDLSVMRSSLIPALLQNAKRLLDYGTASIGLCEAGNVFYDACEQELHIAGVRYGNIRERSWLEKTRSADVFDVKGDAFAVLSLCGVDERSITIIDEAPSYYHPTKSGTILRGRNKLGHFGELHPKVSKLLGFLEKVVCFEIFPRELRKLNTQKPYSSGKVFPKIHRDFAFLFASKASVGNTMKAIYEIDPLITKVAIFDCFESSITQKSVGISITLEAFDRTLTEDEAQVVSNKIIKYMESLGGELRRK